MSHFNQKIQAHLQKRKQVQMTQTRIRSAIIVAGSTLLYYVLT